MIAKVVEGEGGAQAETRVKKEKAEKKAARMGKQAGEKGKRKAERKAKRKAGRTDMQAPCYHFLIDKKRKRSMS